MNEYFVKVQARFREGAPITSTEALFIRADSGEKAYKVAKEQIRKKYYLNWGTSRELLGMELLDIHRL